MGGARREKGGGGGVRVSREVWEIIKEAAKQEGEGREEKKKVSFSCSARQGSISWMLHRSARTQAEAPEITEDLIKPAFWGRHRDWEGVGRVELFRDQQ